MFQVDEFPLVVLSVMKHKVSWSFIINTEMWTFEGIVLNIVQIMFSLKIYLVLYDSLTVSSDFVPVDGDQFYL